MSSNKKLGELAYGRGYLAEDIAIRYLKQQNWSILQQRFRCPFGEIDIIASKSDWLLFVEVKARKTMNDALYALTIKQRKRLFDSASYYLELYNIIEIDNVRFDLIAIDQLNQIEHIENITSI